MKMKLILTLTALLLSTSAFAGANTADWLNFFGRILAPPVVVVAPTPVYVAPTPVYVAPAVDVIPLGCKAASDPVACARTVQQWNEPVAPSQADAETNKANALHDDCVARRNLDSTVDCTNAALAVSVPVAPVASQVDADAADAAVPHAVPAADIAADLGVALGQTKAQVTKLIKEPKLGTKYVSVEGVSQLQVRYETFTLYFSLGAGSTLINVEGN